MCIRDRLHDVGHFINRKAHHRHGEYLIRNGDIPGLRGWRCEMAVSYTHLDVYKRQVRRILKERRNDRVKRTPKLAVRVCRNAVAALSLIHI